MAIAGRKILKQNTARSTMLDGILDVYETVASTYGPRGRTVAFDRGGNIRLTKDGLTVAKEIKFSDETKNFGAILIKEAASKSNYISGDGSTSTTILTAALCNEAHKLLTQGININDLREGYRVAKEFTLAELAKHKIEVKDEKKIFEIAKISANGDEEIAKHISDAFLSIGDNGIVSIVDSLSRKGETAVKITSGLEFDRGFLSSQSVNSTNDQCILTEPKILLSANVLNVVEELQAIIQPLQIKKQPIVVIAPDFDDEVLAWFREQLSRKAIEGSLVLAPGISKNTINDNLVDLAVMTNAKIWGQDFNTNEYDDEFLGGAGKIVITKGKTAIIDAHTDSETFDKHIELLKAKIDHDSAEVGYSEFEIETVKERVAKMTGGVATILVGALTTTALGEKKDRYEDAINSVRATLKNGYLPGAGNVLMRISYQLPDDKLKLGATAAFRSFMKALKLPAKRLILSAGGDYEVVFSDLLKEDNMAIGYDAKSGKIVNLLEAGIIDPYDIVYNSLLYASDVAESFMSIDSVIVTDIPNLTINSLDEVLNDDGMR